MTSAGMLQHEGSSAPRDPYKTSHKAASSAAVFVLDIQDLAPQPSREMALTLRKPDERRRTTQTWHFTDVSLHIANNEVKGNNDVCINFLSMSVMFI